MGPEEFLKQFTQLWKGGYWEGDPLNPLAPSSYQAAGYNSVLYTTFLACIRPYVDQRTTALEIGPGRGAWTKAILRQDPKQIYVLDAAPPEHTCFWEYVGRDHRVTYLTVKDFSMDGVPDGSVNYFFSFGVFCHLPPEYCKQYIDSLYSKLTPGANAFLMIADFDKYNSLVRQMEGQVFPVSIPSARKFQQLDKTQHMTLANDDGFGAWYHLGTTEACEYLERVGFRVVEKDVGVNFRDPVIHFQK